MVQRWVGKNGRGVRHGGLLDKASRGRWCDRSNIPRLSFAMESRISAFASVLLSGLAAAADLSGLGLRPPCALLPVEVSSVHEELLSLSMLVSLESRLDDMLSSVPVRCRGSAEVTCKTAANADKKP